MKYGICICGLNGCGKTTLAAALAKELDFKHMDIEDYYFVPSDNPYASSRTREEAEVLLLEDIRRNPRFVFSAVNGNMNPEINACYDLVVYLDVPAETRMKRIRDRAFGKFGNRILPGGDMYEQEEAFFGRAEKRNAAPILEWVKTLPCRTIFSDGTKPIEENVKNIIAEISLHTA